MFVSSTRVNVFDKYMVTDCEKIGLNVDSICDKFLSSATTFFDFPYFADSLAQSCLR